MAQAKGSAQAFDALRKEYETNAKIYGRDVTRYRLYLETLDKVLPNAQVYVMDTENGGAMTLRLYTNPQQVSEGTQQK
ncbi:MAG: hypothetical protein M1546_18040 [Chloroflexi bacterium]|nr:hypothetical protein [Chloroflexota bacterium]